MTRLISLLLAVAFVPSCAELEAVEDDGLADQSPPAAEIDYPAKADPLVSCWVEPSDVPRLSCRLERPDLISSANVRCGRNSIALVATPTAGLNWSTTGQCDLFPQTGVLVLEIAAAFRFGNVDVPTLFPGLELTAKTELDSRDRFGTTGFTAEHPFELEWPFTIGTFTVVDKTTRGRVMIELPRTAYTLPPKPDGSPASWQYGNTIKLVRPAGEAAGNEQSGPFIANDANLVQVTEVTAQYLAQQGRVPFQLVDGGRYTATDRGITLEK